MRCPKCHNDNPDDALFCENCDHRMDQPVRREGPFMSPRYATLIALALGAVSLLFYFIAGAAIAAVCTGAVGIVLGTYSLRVSRSVKGDDKTLMLILAVAATILSAAGFILGISQLG